jgi:cytochrome c553
VPAFAALLTVLVALVVLLGAAGCARDRSAPGLYRSYCKRCHGGNGEGKPRAVKLYPMPGFKRRLTAEELESLVDFTIRLASPEGTGKKD